MLAFKMIISLISATFAPWSWFSMVQARLIVFFHSAINGKRMSCEQKLATYRRDEHSSSWRTGARTTSSTDKISLAICTFS